jgi:glyoxylase-like metal-dependent hydrolase (beta-lactamase superfamily II)
MKASMAAVDPISKFQEYTGKSPEDAKFFWTGGPVEVAPRTWFASIFSGSTTFETDDGLVVVDAGMARLGPGIAAMIRQKTTAPVHTAIYTHGHVDHAYGLRAFLTEGQPRPRVVGHANMPARFMRYELTQGHNQALNARQFGGAVQAAKEHGGYDTFRAPALPPDTIYDDDLTLTVGGVRFDLHHAKGETDDHTWVFCPDRGVLCPGDLFIWGVPNAGNPQKVQRYPWAWADALRKMAACRSESMCPGHGGPVVRDAARIQSMLLETADYLDALVGETLRAMEQGSPPHVDVVHAVRIPKSDSPWLQPVYDEAEFIIHNVIRFYGGWFSGRPSELKPSPRETLAREVATLAGGAVVLAERAHEIAGAGDMRLACHLADYALEAEPENPKVRDVVAEIYERRAANESSLMAVNLFRSAAAYAKEGRAFR